MNFFSSSCFLVLLCLFQFVSVSCSSVVSTESNTDGDADSLDAVESELEMMELVDFDVQDHEHLETDLLDLEHEISEHDFAGDAELYDTDLPDADSSDTDLPDIDLSDTDLADSDSLEISDFLNCTSPSACPFDLGCTDGFCKACKTANDCRPLDGCVSGVCGACESDLQCRKDENCLSDFCLLKTIRTFEITMDAAEFIELSDNIDYHSDKFYNCVLSVDGLSYNVGEKIRMLGNFSRSFPKKSFRITFPEDMPNPGYSRKINLKADWDDPTLQRSFVSYHLYRYFTDVPTPRVRYAKLFVNGVFYGLMLEIERIGGKFLEKNDRDRTQSLYEAAANYISGTFVPNPDLTSYKVNYHKKSGDEEDYSDLISLIEDTIWPDFLDSETLDPDRKTTSATRTLDILDLEQYLKYWTINILIMNSDTVTNNFYFSHQKDKQGNYKWEFYPWDMDLSLGCGWTGQIDDVCSNIDGDSWWLNGVLYENETFVNGEKAWWSALHHLMLLEPQVQMQVRQIVCDYLASNYFQQRIYKLIDALDQHIWDELLPDTNDQITSREDYIEAIQGLKSFFPLRETYLLEENQLECSELLK